MPEGHPDKQLPLLIGKYSSGELFMADLWKMPNLFVSYSNDEQLPHTFITFINDLLRMPSTTVALSLSSRLAAHILPLIPPQQTGIKYLHADFQPGKVNTIDEFIKQLVIELKTRKQFIKKTKGKAVLPPLVVLIDNLFEVIRSPDKKVALSFIRLLMRGETVHIFFIMGSPGIYKALLDTLIHIADGSNRKLKSIIIPKKPPQPLGAELVINPDGLLFYREKNEKIHIRLYP